MYIVFVAHALQQGEGCGWTIGCGQILWKLKATTKTEAVEELKCRVLGEWLPEDGEYEGGCEELRKLTLFEVADKEEISLDKLYAEGADYIRQAEVRAKEEKDRADYERLKRKFD